MHLKILILYINELKINEKINENLKSLQFLNVKHQLLLNKLKLSAFQRTLLLNHPHTMIVNTCL